MLSAWLLLAQIAGSGDDPQVQINVAIIGGIATLMAGVISGLITAYASIRAAQINHQAQTPAGSPVAQSRPWVMLAWICGAIFVFFLGMATTLFYQALTSVSVTVTPSPVPPSVTSQPAPAPPPAALTSTPALPPATPTVLIPPSDTPLPTVTSLAAPPVAQVTPPLVLATATPVPPPVLPSATPGVQRDYIGRWYYGKPRPPMPAPAGPGQVIFASGDINDSGSCHVKTFGPGVPVQGLGNATFDLWRITGTPEQIAEVTTELQSAAAADPHAGGTCPELH